LLSLKRHTYAMSISELAPAVLRVDCHLASVNAWRANSTLVFHQAILEARRLRDVAVGLAEGECREKIAAADARHDASLDALEMHMAVDAKAMDSAEDVLEVTRGQMLACEKAGRPAGPWVDALQAWQFAPPRRILHVAVSEGVVRMVRAPLKTDFQAGEMVMVDGTRWIRFEFDANIGPLKPEEVVLLLNGTSVPFHLRLENCAMFVRYDDDGTTLMAVTEMVVLGLSVASVFWVFDSAKAQVSVALLNGSAALLELADTYIVLAGSRHAMFVITLLLNHAANLVQSFGMMQYRHVLAVAIAVSVRRDDLWECLEGLLALFWGAEIQTDLLSGLLDACSLYLKLPRLEGFRRARALEITPLCPDWTALQLLVRGGEFVSVT